MYTSRCSSLRIALSDRYIASSTLPSLRKLTICTIFGGQARIAHGVLVADNNPNQSNDNLEACIQLTIRVFGSSPLEDVCTRGSSGLFSFPPIVNLPQRTLKTIKPINFHYEFFDKYLPTAVNGLTTRWIMEQHEREQQYRPEQLRQSTLVAVQDQVVERKRYRQRMADSKIDLEIYASIPPQARIMKGSMDDFTKQGEREKAGIKEDLKYLKQALKSDGWPGKGDRLDWFAMHESPACAACGSSWEPESKRFANWEFKG